MELKISKVLYFLKIVHRLSIRKPVSRRKKTTFYPISDLVLNVLLYIVYEGRLISSRNCFITEI